MWARVHACTWCVGGAHVCVWWWYRGGAYSGNGEAQAAAGLQQLTLARDHFKRRFVVTHRK